MSIKNTPITAAEARALFAELRGALLVSEQTIAQIIQTRAWEALGYSTLTEAWEAEMKGVRLAGAIQARLLYAMFEGGATIANVALAVTGVGAAKAPAYHQAYQAGMTAQQAERHVAATTHEKPVAVTSHARKSPTRKGAIHMEGFTDEEIATWRTFAKANGQTLNQWAADVFRNAVTWSMASADAA